MSAEKQEVRKGFRQKKQPTKGQVQQQNQTLEDMVKGKIMSLEGQVQFLGSLLGQTMNNSKALSETVDALQLLAATTKIPAGQVALKEDCVLVDYTGVLLTDKGEVEVDADGIEMRFQGGSGLKYLVQDLGAGKLLPGFENAILGKPEGSLLEAEVEFPKDYGSKELQGRKARFKIYIHAIYRRLPVSVVEAEVQDHQKRRSAILKAKAEAAQAAKAKAAENTKEAAPQ